MAKSKQAKNKQEKADEKTSSESDLDSSALSALASLGSVPPPPAAESADEDGVLDLRALVGMPSSVGEEPAPDSDDEKIDLKAIGTLTAAEKENALESVLTKATQPANAPAPMAPVVPDAAHAVPAAAGALAAPPKKSSMLWIGIAAGIGVAGVIYVVLGRASEEPVVVAEQQPATRQEAEAATAPIPSHAAAAEPVPSQPTIEAAPAPTAVVEEERSASAPAEDGAAREGRTKNAGEPARTAGNAAAANTGQNGGSAPAVAATPATSTSAANAPAAAAATTQTPARPATPPPEGANLEDVLDRALGGRPVAGGTRAEPVAQPAAPAPAANRDNLPPTPNRTDVSRILGGLLPAIKMCAGEQTGLATATILIKNDGTVASVSIGGGPFGGTPAASCMEGVVRRAHFPPFQQTTFRLTYPFSIRPPVQP